MTRSVTVLIAGWLLALFTVAVRLQAAAPLQSNAVASSQAASEQALLNRYCVSCHNERLQTAGLQLSTGIDNPGADAARWEKVVRKLRAGVMPPPGLPRPDAAVYRTLTSSLEQALDRAAAAHPNP